MIRRVVLLLAALIAGTAAAAEPAPRPAAPTAPAGTNTTTVLVLGDSLAAGYGVALDEAWPALVQRKITRAGLAATVVNAGLSGDTTAGGLRRIDWQLRRRADVLLVELGGNDGLRGFTPETTRSNLVAIIARARAKWPDVRVVVAGLQMPASMGADYADKFAAVFPDVARSEHAVLIPQLLAGVGGVPELNQADQIHPTPAGHERVAENVWQVLEPILRPPRP